MSVTFSSWPFGALRLDFVTASDAKTTLVASDRLVLSDSADGNKVKLVRIDKLPGGGGTGPQGPPGEQGPPGPAGPQGPQGAPGGVASFNGRTGVVQPASNDYTPSMVGAASSNHIHSISGVTGLQAELDEKSVEVLLPDMTVNGTTPLGGAALLRGAITDISLNNTDKIIIVINIANGPVVVTVTGGFTLMNPDGSAGGFTYSLPNGGTKAVFWRRTVQQWMRIQ